MPDLLHGPSSLLKPLATKLPSCIDFALLLLLTICTIRWDTIVSGQNVKLIGCAQALKLRAHYYLCVSGSFWNVVSTCPYPDEVQFGPDPP